MKKKLSMPIKILIIISSVFLILIIIGLIGSSLDKNTNKSDKKDIQTDIKKEDKPNPVKTASPNNENIQAKNEEEKRKLDSSRTEIIKSRITFLKDVSKKGNYFKYDLPYDIIKMTKEYISDYKSHDEWSRGIKTMSELVKQERQCLQKALVNNLIHARYLYYSKAKDAMWENDVDVKLSGKNNTELTFIGAIFANNANKSSFQKEISDLLKEYRFKRVNYKWYKYDDEYTYYDLDTPNDTSLSY